MAGLYDSIRARMSSLFGKDSSPAERQKTISLDLITSDLDHIPEGALAALWELLDRRNPHTPRMIRLARAAMNGEIRAKMAPEWDLQDRQDFHVGGPDAFVRPRETANRLSSKECRIKRPLMSFGPTEQQNSTRIEQWGNSILDDQYADYETTEMNLNEGQSLWIAQPSSSHWKVMPTLYDEFGDEGDLADQATYDALPAGRKRQYERANPSEDTPQYKRMRKRYRVNARGQEDDGSDAFEVDYKQASKTFASDLEDIRARNCPIIMRGPISRLNYIALAPAFSGKRTTSEGVIIRTLYRQSKLAREYAWQGCEQLLEPVDSLAGVDGDFWLYELWAYDHEGRPFVAYQVGKHATRFSDTGATAVIRLSEEYPGITELPIAFEYGNHTADPNPDKRGLPFPIPFLDNWKQRDAILTALCISIAKSGYPTWIQVLTKDSIDVMNSIEGDVDLTFEMRPNSVQYAVGQLIEVTSKGTNADVKTAFEALGVLNERELPNKGALGGEGPSSGLERQIQGKDFEVTFKSVIEAGRRQKEAMGRYALMIGSAIGRLADQPVELYAIGTAPNPQTGGTAKTRTRLTLPPDICKDNWDVVAEFETVPGEKLAQSSLFLEALAQGAILMREWREWALGDTNPEQFMWEKMLEDFYLRDPAGRLSVYKGMLDYVGDEKTKQMLELAHQGQLTSPQNGVATSAMNNLLGSGQAGQPGQPTNTGVQYGNPAQSQLAGAVGGAVSASAASAGSPLDGGSVAA